MGADFPRHIHAMFYLTKAADPHTKGAIYNFTAGLAQLLAEKGIRANAVAPGPIWTPLIPSTLPEDAVAKFGRAGAMKPPGQPAELATAFVMLADPLSSLALRSLSPADGRCCERRNDHGEADEPA